jgi:hypothetical protein
MVSPPLPKSIRGRKILLKHEPPEVSWVQFFHDQAVDSLEYVKKAADQIPEGIRDSLLSIVTWTEQMEHHCDSWCDAVYKQNAEEIRLNIILEEEIKTLFAAIRATKHQDSIRALREAARDSGNRI